MMKTYYLSALLLIALLTLPVAHSSQVTVETITQDEVKSSLSAVGNHRFIYRMFFNLYDAKFYTDAAQIGDIDKLLDGKNALLLEFDYLRKIKKSIILESSENILAKNMSPDDLDLIQERLDRINEAYRTVDKGDRSGLSYIPGKGTTLSINKEPIVTIEGEDFARLYFRIWLGEQPISQSMRDALLSRN
ncbi:MAG: hypothetical protein ACI92G_001816 [Candidatus Pelagisphaera sp.]|jgi:hypothetical protein